MCFFALRGAVSLPLPAVLELFGGILLPPVIPRIESGSPSQATTRCERKKRHEENAIQQGHSHLFEVVLVRECE